MATPSEVLRKYKPASSKKTDKKEDMDDKKPGVKRDALVDFIAKCKKG